MFACFDKWLGSRFRVGPFFFFFKSSYFYFLAAKNFVRLKEISSKEVLPLLGSRRLLNEG